MNYNCNITFDNSNIIVNIQTSDSSQHTALWL